MIINMDAAVISDLILIARLCESKAKNSPFWYLAYKDEDLKMLARRLDALETEYRVQVARAGVCGRYLRP